MWRRYPNCNQIRLVVAAALAGAALAGGLAPGASAAPAVTISLPLGGTVTNVRTPAFSGTGDPVGSAVTLNVYRGTEASGTALESPSALIGPEGAWSLELLAALEDGVYTAQASQQAGGETGLSAPVTFAILTTAPIVTLVQPSLAAGESTPVFSGTASDVTAVTVQIHAGGSPEGALVSVATAAGTGAAWRSSPASPSLPAGHYTAVAVQKSSLKGNPPGLSAAVGFDVLPAPPPPSPAPSQSGVASLAAAVHPAPRVTPLMAPFPVVRIAGVTVGGGVRLELLKVQQVPAGALIRVRCVGRGCPRTATVRRTTASGPHGVPAIVFGRFERYLHAGTVLQVFISEPGAIGKYTRLRVRRGKLPERVDLCLDTSGQYPRPCAAG